MKISILLVLVLFAGCTLFNSEYSSAFDGVPSSDTGKGISENDVTIANAFSNHESNLQVSGQGIVTALLPDDNNGSRHQKFIIRLSSGQTLLVTHNIDIAPRIDSLQTGDSVQFYGEYEWNEKGGVIHWTHHDPKGVHVSGWLQHRGQRYQ